MLEKIEKTHHGALINKKLQTITLSKVERSFEVFAKNSYNETFTIYFNTSSFSKL